jgi:hypothetical protein
MPKAMNTKEKVQFIEDNKVIVPIPATAEKIAQTIILIQQKLENKAINRFINAGVKEGYLMAIEVLESGFADLGKIGKLKTVQGRAIALLANDYLLGECSQEMFVAVPIKER